MGVIKRGLLGGFSGKVANIVGSSWKGIAVMKSLPLSVANPRTAAQQSQRGKFTLVNAFAKAILVQVVKPMWDRFAQGKSGINEFVSTNIGIFGNTQLDDPSAMVIAKGTLTGVEGANVAGNTIGDVVEIVWTDNTGTGNAQASDRLYAVVYNAQGDLVEGFDTGANRSEAGVDVSVSFNLVVGTTYYVALAFRALDGTRVSNTVVDSFIAV